MFSEDVWIQPADGSCWIARTVEAFHNQVLGSPSPVYTLIPLIFCFQDELTLLAFLSRAWHLSHDSDSSRLQLDRQGRPWAQLERIYGLSCLTISFRFLSFEFKKSQEMDKPGRFGRTLFKSDSDVELIEILLRKSHDSSEFKRYFLVHWAVEKVYKMILAVFLPRQNALIKLVTMEGHYTRAALLLYI